MYGMNKSVDVKDFFPLIKFAYRMSFLLFLSQNNHQIIHLYFLFYFFQKSLKRVDLIK
jgi:hypothetical protein